MEALIKAIAETVGSDDVRQAAENVKKHSERNQSKPLKMISWENASKN